MSADQLRTAAERLRALAEAATPAYFDAEGDFCLVSHDTWRDDAYFIAAMDPNVARLLADWLSKYAELLPDEEDVRLWNRPAFDDLPAALALAEYVNRRAQ